MAVLGGPVGIPVSCHVREGNGPACCTLVRTFFPNRRKSGFGFSGECQSARISVLNIWVQLYEVLQRLYSCGFQRDQPLLEDQTQWVRNRISRFSFPSTLL
jgi:hypothetical protein